MGTDRYYMRKARYTVEPTAISPTTAAATVRIVSVELAGPAEAWGTERAGALEAAAARGAAVAPGAAVAREAGAGAGAAAGLVPVAGGGPGFVPAAPGPPGGRVGSLIVGAAEGLGGSVMRTVSFLG